MYICIHTYRYAYVCVCVHFLLQTQSSDNKWKVFKELLAEKLDPAQVQLHLVRNFAICLITGEGQEISAKANQANSR